MTPMASVRDLLDGAYNLDGDDDKAANWSPPRRLEAEHGLARRDAILSFRDLAERIAGMTEVAPADLRLA